MSTYSIYPNYRGSGKVERAFAECLYLTFLVLRARLSLHWQLVVVVALG
jgi:hypothetical protein